MTNKKGQEEMIGFAMIVIIVAVILLVLLGIALNKPQTSTVESYEVESFILSMLQHTTSCSTDSGLSYKDVEDLIAECNDEQVCGDGKTTCAVLNSTLGGIMSGAWKTGQDAPVKGYALNITSRGTELTMLMQGNATSNYKTGFQSFSKRGTSYSIYFNVYY